MGTQTEIRPQRAQLAFLSSLADVAVFGGAAGGGKSFSLLLEPLYHISNRDFRGIVFRRTYPQIKLQGGLWDVSAELYARVGAVANQASLTWTFPSGATVSFRSMEHTSDRFSYQGLQASYIAFDELSQFEPSQFWYLFSRLRSMSGIRGYIRCTTNPDCDSFLRQLLDWWIDGEGLAIPARSGVLRWFVRIEDELHWADTREALLQQFGPDCDPKSLTFVPSRIFDNQVLMQRDPSYLSNLRALPLIDRRRLLDGDWNIRPRAGNFFRKQWFRIVEAAPQDTIGRVRYWDRAATPISTDCPSPDASVGLLLSKTRQGIYVVEDVIRLHATPLAVQRAMQNAASQDGIGTTIAFMQDPGSAGVNECQQTARALDGYYVKFGTATGDKQTRARPISAQAEAGNVVLVKGDWNDAFLRELEGFPNAAHDDQVDALSGAHELLAAPSGAFSASDIPKSHSAASMLDAILPDAFNPGCLHFGRHDRLGRNDF
jgi:predicted phage terminase large subunit-like protein